MAGLLPEWNRLLDKTSLAIVSSKEFWLSCRSLGKTLLQKLSDPAVILASFAPEQRFVGSIANKGMLELVSRVRRNASYVEQFRIGQTAQRLSKSGSPIGWIACSNSYENSFPTTAPI